MSVDREDFIDNSVLSNCCGAPALGEVINGEGMCSDCKEHAEFEENEEESTQVHNTEVDKNLPGSSGIAT